MRRSVKIDPPSEPGKPAPSGGVTRSDGNGLPPTECLLRHWRSFAVCLFLALAVWVVFGQTRQFDFVNFDDNICVYDNPAVCHGFSLPGVVGILTHVNGAGEWVPLTALSRMLDCQLFGLHPAGHHLTNVLLHTATACLLFLLLRRLTGGFWPSAFAAALFAIHPLRVESVAWVTERKDVLSGLFFVLTLLAYERFAQRPLAGANRVSGSAISTTPASTPRLWTLEYNLALTFFALGLLSKPMLVTLPFVMLLLDYWPLNRLAPVASPAERTLLQAWSTLLFEKIPFLLLSSATCVVTVLAQRNAIGSAHAFGLATRIENALVAYVVYLRQLGYPAGLAAFYPHPRGDVSPWEIGLSLLILLAISVGTVTGRRRCPYLLVGWLWYLGMLVPVIGFLQVGDQAWADRYTYLPQIGLYILLAWGARDWCGDRRQRRLGIGFAAVAILGIFLALARIQTRYWRDSLSLWTHTLACTSKNYMAHNNLGMALAAQGWVVEAIGHFEQALQFQPDDVKAHINLGVALANQGRFAEAADHYAQALRLKPDEAEAHNNLGIALAAQGRATAAVEHYQRALQLQPDYAEAHNNLGVALASQGRTTDALKHYLQALQLKPDFAQAHYNLGNAYAGLGQPAEAIGQFELALQLKPDYAEAHNNLGMVLASQGNFAAAIEHYERTLQLRPDVAEPHFNLGNALASQGRAVEAIHQLQQALTLARAQGNHTLAQSIQTQLDALSPGSPSPTH
ncbi:MAG TPA: tetratricopeptide repeat protein [Candidatus Acidoferrum sp.]|nr:tetratricopeptide repeat protein [Candidatus Acidoferrum sp.]